MNPQPPGRVAAERDRGARPIHYEIAKHAKAAATHRAALRDWIVKAHDEGIDHAEIADLAGVTIGAIEACIEQVEALRDQSDLVYAGR